MTQQPATSTLFQAWGNPSGLLGRLAGWEMSRGKGALNEVLTELLPVSGMAWSSRSVSAPARRSSIS